MHAQRIIQKLLDTDCPQIHAKRRICLATMVEAGSCGKLYLMGISRSLSPSTSIRHRIKRCDRLLGNPNLEKELRLIYRAMAHRVLHGIKQPFIIIDWSDLRPDRSYQLLRATIVIKGRSLTLYEEVHPQAKATSPKVHNAFMHNLSSILPKTARPIIVTDAGFRAPWFKLLDTMGWPWVGRIRNRDMVCSPNKSWVACKTLYAKARAQAKDLGPFLYVRSNAVACRLVTIKKTARGRYKATAHGKKARNAQSLKQAKGQKEPWLLAVSTQLDALSAAAIVAIYGTRMQIEQTFRDTKNPRWGLGLSESQTKKPNRFAALLLIGALVCYALWLVGLAAQAMSYSIQFGSKQKAKSALSIISLARWWCRETNTILTRRQINAALSSLQTLVKCVHEQVLSL